MLQFFGILINIFLILIICLRLPKETGGLESFATKSNILGSPSSAQNFLNIFTVSGIVIYISIAFQLNLQNS